MILQATWKFNRWNIREGSPSKKGTPDRTPASPGQLIITAPNIPFKFSIQENDYFDVEPETGKVFLVSPIDREEIQKLKLKVYAKDSAGNEVEPSTEIEIYVDDLNDNEPIFEKASYEGRVKENSKKGNFFFKKW